MARQSVIFDKLQNGFDQELPGWLTAIDTETINQALPLADLLEGSLYYPSAAFDGAPIASVAGIIHSFIYVDYGVSREVLFDKIRERGFLGYNIVAQRAVTEKELAPGGWTLPILSREDGNPNTHRDLRKSPFCEWLIFQRNDDFPAGHGPRRFSLLYLCADGVAAFQALYVGNRKSPAAVAIIQPGHAFGGNWTNYEDPTQIFARTVLGNPSGTPTHLLFGGSGGKDFYREPCWPEYSEPLGFLGSTSIGVWRRSLAGRKS